MATTGLVYDTRRRGRRPRSWRRWNAARPTPAAVKFTAIAAADLSYRVGKRVLDVGVAVAALLAGAPLAALVATVSTLTSRGPVLFAQERVGLHGRLFTLYKFRTLPHRPSFLTDRVWTGLAPEEAGVFGRFLRRTGLDEWPQFWNVLRGDMSVVGPRPERAHFANQFARRFPDYAARHAVKPGITGWAQVHGWRGDTDIAERLACDLRYMRDWSLRLDLRILLLTPAQVLRQVWGTRPRLPFGLERAPARRGRVRQPEECTSA